MFFKFRSIRYISEQTRFYKCSFISLFRFPLYFVFLFQIFMYSFCVMIYVDFFNLLLTLEDAVHTDAYYVIQCIELVIYSSALLFTLSLAC